MIGHDGDDPTTLSTGVPPRGLSILAEVEAYWRSLRRGGRLPARADVDPKQIDAALPHAFVLERVAPGIARLRVAGQALTAHVGTEARGMPLTCLFDAGSRAALAGHLDDAFDAPAIVDVGVRATSGAFRQRQDGRLLLLPLLGSGGEASQAMGALLLDGRPGRAPCRFEIPDDAAVRREPLALAPPFVRAAGYGAAHGGLSEAERPWLRLVVSNG